MRNGSREDILYCDYGYDSDASRNDALVPVASAGDHKDLAFHIKHNNAWILAKKKENSGVIRKMEQDMKMVI